MAAYDLQAVLETQVIDKLLVVMKNEDQKLAQQIAKLGTNVGSVSTWADRPTVDENGAAVTVDDVFTLTQTDGSHPAGKYGRKPDNSDWEDTPFIDYDALNINQIIADAKAGASDLTYDTSTHAFVASQDNKFSTPKQIKDALEVAFQDLTTLYHPKGGDVNLKVVGKDADENTQEFVTANQLNATFTVSQIQQKYDAL